MQHYHNTSLQPESVWRALLALLFILALLPFYATATIGHSPLDDCKSSRHSSRSLLALGHDGSDDDSAADGPAEDHLGLPHCPGEEHGCCTNAWDQLVFLHIPKSGGTALYYALWDALPTLRNTTKGEIKPCINRATAHIKNRLQLDHMCRTEETVARTVCMLNEVFPHHCRFLRLHFDFSVVTEVIAPKTKKSLGLLTIMRQPADRVNSAYRFASAIHGTLKDFVYGKAGAQENHFGGANHATKQMAGVLEECSQLSPERKEHLMEHPEKMLRLAKRHLDRFCVIIYEYMKESIEYLRIVYGLPTLALRPRQYNAGDHRSVPFDDHKMIMEANPLDAQLYNYSLMLFAQRYKAVTGKTLPAFPHSSVQAAAYSPYDVSAKHNPE
eukprot:jgi/Mesvir1/6683/Mv08910-RA.1